MAWKYSWGRKTVLTRSLPLHTKSTFKVVFYGDGWARRFSDFTVVVSQAFCPGLWPWLLKLWLSGRVMQTSDSWGSSGPAPRGVWVLGHGAWHGLKSDVTLEAPMKGFEKPMQQEASAGNGRLIATANAKKFWKEEKCSLSKRNKEERRERTVRACMPPAACLRIDVRPGQLIEPVLCLVSYIGV